MKRNYKYRDSRECLWCGKPYVAIREYQKFCKKEHGAAYGRKKRGRYFGGADRVCHNCDAPYQARVPSQKFCSPSCSSENYTKEWRGINQVSPLATGTVGAISELRVAADLMDRGYNVFRALSPSCPCDLAILKGGKLLRVEVTTAYRSVSGKIQSSKNRADIGVRHDIVVYVLRKTNEIIYEPPFSNPKTA